MRPPEHKQVAPVAPELLREAVAEDLAVLFSTEEELVEFLLELRPLRGIWEVVEMAKNNGGDIRGFWLLGVREWLERDPNGERLAELRRAAQELRPAFGVPGLRS